MDELDRLVDEYIRLLRSLPRDSPVRAGEVRRIIELVNPDSDDYETSDAVIGFYQDGIERLRKVATCDQ